MNRQRVKENPGCARGPVHWPLSLLREMNNLTGGFRCFGTAQDVVERRDDDETTRRREQRDGKFRDECRWLEAREGTVAARLARSFRPFDETSLVEGKKIERGIEERVQVVVRYLEVFGVR